LCDVVGPVAVQQRAGFEGLPDPDVRGRSFAAHPSRAGQRCRTIFCDRGKLVWKGMVFSSARSRRNVPVASRWRLAAGDSTGTAHTAGRRSNASLL